LIALTFGLFFALMAIGVPISFAFGIAGAALLPLVGGSNILAMVPQRVMVSLDAFVLLAVPMFILAGTIMGTGGVADRLVKLAMAFVGPIRGGLGMVVIVSTVFFSGVSGSSNADTAAIGSITLPAMRRRGYPVPLATAIVAAGGATAVLIPPVIDLVLIGAIANISIAALFAAGIVPGILNAISIVALTYFIARRLNLPTEPRLSLREMARALVAGIPALGMALIILGGILGGVFTPTEAAAIAVVYGLLVSAFVYRDLKWSAMPRILSTTVRITGIVFLLLGLGSVFGWLLNFIRLPQAVGEWMASIPDPVIFLLVVNVVFFLVGMFLETLPVLVVLMPILTPVAANLGIHPVHFGILVEANLAVGFITPPVGSVLYTACALARLPLEAVIKPLLPYIFVLAAMVLVITYVASLSLFLPRLLGLV
jgi:C4-dicarboxylate transporter DctM subunit